MYDKILSNFSIHRCENPAGRDWGKSTETERLSQVPIQKSFYELSPSGLRWHIFKALKITGDTCIYLDVCIFLRL